uniref:Uncharacterized protein n=1 Tax=Chloropicon roscoffensis TaxID=1461544 RepID=A0A7S3C663_9CHLO|mmetsp:Transcript_10412/g.31843  ORF Transcript_10412/g.31843 Transcript_10412/m.31843 type:complete len:467 (+) Transcript_10412:70-1470(+)
MKGTKIILLLVALLAALGSHAMAQRGGPPGLARSRASNVARQRVQNAVQNGNLPPGLANSRASNVARQVVANLPAPARQRVQNAVQNGNIPQPRQVPQRLRGIASRATPDQRQEFFSGLPEGVQDRLQRARSVPAGERRSAALSFLQRVRERRQEAASNDAPDADAGNLPPGLARSRASNVARQVVANLPAPARQGLQNAAQNGNLPPGLAQVVSNLPVPEDVGPVLGEAVSDRIRELRRESADLGGALARMLRDPSLVDGELRTTIRHVLERRIPEDMTVGDLLDRIQSSDFEPTEAEAERIARFRERLAESMDMDITMDSPLSEFLNDFDLRELVPQEDEGEAADGEVTSFSGPDDDEDEVEGSSEGAFRRPFWSRGRMPFLRRWIGARGRRLQSSPQRTVALERIANYKAKVASRIRDSDLSHEQKVRAIRVLKKRLENVPPMVRSAWMKVKEELKSELASLD